MHGKYLSLPRMWESLAGKTGPKARASRSTGKTGQQANMRALSLSFEYKIVDHY
jgi:hypothetical protein